MHASLFSVKNRLMTQLTNLSSFSRPCRFFSIFVVISLSHPLTNRFAIADSPQTQVPSTQSSPELGTLKSWLDEQVSKSRVPGGSLLIVHRGKVVFREAFGVASPTTKKPFTIDAPVRIASITKPIVATGIIALAADGKISLDEPVSTWLPEFRNIQLTSGKPAKRAPNIRELLSHTGGVIADDAPQGRPWLKTWAFKAEATLEDAVKWAADQKLASEPGTEFAYSGCGFDIAVRAVEVACKVRFEDELQKRVFTPLGMHHSTFRPDRKLQSEIPPGFNLTKDGFVPITRTPRDFNDKTYVTYGGTLVSIIDDLSKFMQFHLDRGKFNGHQLVSEKAIREMHRKPSWSKTGYGLGWSLGNIAKDGSRITIGHTGSSGTACSMDFQKQGFWILFTQMPQPRSPELAPHFQLLVREKAKKVLEELEQSSESAAIVDTK
jgi:CubicO group peptidase (beta-lactamase class C family)